MGPRQGAHPLSDCIFLKLFSCPSSPEDAAAPDGCGGHKVWGEDDSGPASPGWWGALGSLTLLCTACRAAPLCIPTPSSWSGMTCSESLHPSPCAAEGEALTPPSPKPPLPPPPLFQQNPSPWHERLLEKKRAASPKDVSLC